MSVGPIVRFVQSGGAVVLRYYVRPTKLLEEDTKLKDCRSFVTLMTGCILAFPFLRFFGSGLPMESYYVKYEFKFMWIINILLTGSVLGVLQYVIGVCIRRHDAALRYMIVGIYCIAMCMLSFFIIFYVFGNAYQLGIARDRGLSVSMVIAIASCLHMILVNILASINRLPVIIFWSLGIVIAAATTLSS